MSDFQTYDLSNIDPDDISDVLIKVEKSFSIKFGETELETTKTFGELCDIIESKVHGVNANDCTTQQAFYKLRDAIANSLMLDKQTINSNTDLQKLFPKNIRRQSFKEIDRRLDLKTNALRPKYSITGILTISLIASLITLFIFWPAGLTGLAVSIIGMTIAYRLGRQFDLLTVGQLAKRLSRENYIKSRRTTDTVNKSEIVQKITDIFIVDLGLEEPQLTRQASFV